MDNQDHYEEEWIVIVNDNKYELNKQQAEILNNAISQGRGIVQFKEFIISIPFIKEFYLKRRFLKPEYQIAPVNQEEHIETAEEYIKRMEKWKKTKKKIDLLNAKIKKEPVVKTKPMTPKEFEARKKILLEQSERL